MTAAAPGLSKQEAMHFLLHTRAGRDVARHLSAVTKKEHPMQDRQEQLRAIAKDFGVAKLAKYLNEEGRSHGITEFEFSKMIADEAAARKISFTDYYSAPENLEIRKAIQLTKFPDAHAVAKAGGFPNVMNMRPVSVEVGATNTRSDADKAYKQLMAMAQEMRSRAPAMSVASAFARVFEQNPALAAKAHRRPSASSVDTDYLES